ncbi:nitrate/nitrite transporter [Rhodoferax sp.]|uniref:nitrate/nitrite transporter n=1 Tax=Rhodoferax sp. TaxID=50421 RepID=UPI003783E72D
MNFLAPRRAILVFATLAFAYFLSTLVRAITATLAPTLTAEFSLRASDLGLLAGGYFLGFAVTQLPLGAWLDRFGPKRVEVAFLAVAVVGCALFSVAESFAGLLVGRILCGVGVSACLMAALTGYRRWYAPALQMRANSWMLMVGALGMLASTLPVQWLLPTVGWRPLFLFLAAGVVLAMVCIAWQLPRWEPAMLGSDSEGTSDGSSASSGYSEVWRNPYFRRMAPLGFVNYGGLVAIQTLWAGPWMVKVAGYSPAQAALGLFWINACMLVAYLLWGWASPRLARGGHTAERLMVRWVPLSLALVALIAVCGSAIGGFATLALALFCVASTVCSLAQPAVGMAFPSALAGRALSAYNLVIFAGVFSVQWGLGLAIDGLRALGWSDIAAHQGALLIYALLCLWAYLHLVMAKKS